MAWKYLELCRTHCLHNQISLAVYYQGFPRQLTAAGFLKTSVANCRRAFWYFTRVAQPNNMWEQKSAPERNAPDDVIRSRSSEASHQKQVHHQNLQILSKDSNKLFRAHPKEAKRVKRSGKVVTKVIGCLSLKRVDKMHLYEAYNHFLHYSVLCLRYRTRKTALPAEMFPQIQNGFEINSS
ncbi:hypothetical protein MTR_7g006220 [Medicago truncatula]|uniref:Uncharacterized protein n=1 Tax=Medicago truncatula TaxID=3880 RepID=G7KXN5_MEDTR|nr:hypothetical protein MTR_7g006220 [Medicago truncatula]